MNQISFCSDQYDHRSGAVTRHVAFYTRSRAAAIRWIQRNLPMASIARAPYVLVNGQRMTIEQFIGA